MLEHLKLLKTFPSYTEFSSPPHTLGKKPLFRKMLQAVGIEGSNSGKEASKSLEEGNHQVPY